MKKYIVIIVIFIVIILGLAGTVTFYFYNKFQQAQYLLQNPSEATKQETRLLTGAISKLMRLPEDEDPSIATVLDRDKLKDQEFFAHAENGDKILLYTKTRKAILYRPSKNIIIDVADMSISSPSANLQTYSVALYNGTDDDTLLETAKKNIVSTITNISVVAKGDTQKKNYENTLVIDLTGQNKDLAREMAGLIKGTVTALPEGEIKPSANDPVDLLIILGKNYGK